MKLNAVLVVIGKFLYLPSLCYVIHEQTANYLELILILCDIIGRVLVLEWVL